MHAFRKMKASYTVYTHLSWQCNNGYRRWWPNWYRKHLWCKQGIGNGHNHLILLPHLSCAGDSGLTSHESQALDNKPWNDQQTWQHFACQFQASCNPVLPSRAWLSSCCTLINCCYQCRAMWPSTGTVEQLTEPWHKSIVVWRKPCKNKQIES